LTLKTNELNKNNHELQYLLNNVDKTDNLINYTNNLANGTLFLNSGGSNKLASGNGKKNILVKKGSDMSLNEILFKSKESRLNLSISRISLKNNLNETNSSKLRETYKKVNENSILNITNVNAKENQFLKFFTNNSLYEKDKVTAIDLNKTLLKEKVVSTAQTSKKLASDVIFIYRKNVSEKLKGSVEKIEAKEVVTKQINNYKPFTESISKQGIIYETDVERIMRTPVHKYANSVFPNGVNNTTLHHQSVIGINMAKCNVTAIEPTSRLLSPTKNLKPKVKDEILRDSLYTFKPLISKSNVSQTVTSSSFPSIINLKAKVRTKEKRQKGVSDKDAKDSLSYNSNMTSISNLEKQSKKRKLEEGLIINKFKDLVDKANWS
jgi:hypothetical protein